MALLQLTVEVAAAEPEHTLHAYRPGLGHFQADVGYPAVAWPACLAGQPRALRHSLAQGIWVGSAHPAGSGRSR